MKFFFRFRTETNNNIRGNGAIRDYSSYGVHPFFVPDTIIDTIDTIDTSTFVPLRPILPFVLYPNPAQNTLTLANYGYNGSEQLMVYNTLGATVFSKQLLGQSESFSVTGLPNGTYIGVIVSSDGKPLQRFKFLVMH